MKYSHLCFLVTPKRLVIPAENRLGSRWFWAKCFGKGRGSVNRTLHNRALRVFVTTNISRLYWKTATSGWYFSDLTCQTVALPQAWFPPRNRITKDESLNVVLLQLLYLCARLRAYLSVLHKVWGPGSETSVLGNGRNFPLLQLPISALETTHWFNIYSVLREVQSLFQSAFFTECDLVLPLSNSSIFSFL